MRAIYFNPDDFEIWKMQHNIEVSKTKLAVIEGLRGLRNW